MFYLLLVLILLLALGLPLLLWFADSCTQGGEVLWPAALLSILLLWLFQWQLSVVKGLITRWLVHNLIIVALLLALVAVWQLTVVGQHHCGGDYAIYGYSLLDRYWPLLWLVAWINLARQWFKQH